MDATAWNAKYPVGTLVIVTLANRRRRVARTIGSAQHIGQHDFVQVDQIQPGFVLLSWCWPVNATGLAYLARRTPESASEAFRGPPQLA
jgi:hypothetical protein